MHASQNETHAQAWEVSAEDFAALVAAAKTVASWAMAKAIFYASHNRKHLRDSKGKLIKSYRAWATDAFGISERTAEDLKAVYGYFIEPERFTDELRALIVDVAPWTIARAIMHSRVTDETEVREKLGKSKRQLEAERQQAVDAALELHATNPEAVDVVSVGGDEVRELADQFTIERMHTDPAFRQRILEAAGPKLRTSLRPSARTPATFDETLIRKHVIPIETLGLAITIRLAGQVLYETGADDAADHGNDGGAQ